MYFNPLCCFISDPLDCNPACAYKETKSRKFDSFLYLHTWVDLKTQRVMLWSYVSGNMGLTCTLLFLFNTRKEMG